MTVGDSMLPVVKPSQIAKVLEEDPESENMIAVLKNYFKIRQKKQSQRAQELSQKNKTDRLSTSDSPSQEKKTDDASKRKKSEEEGWFEHDDQYCDFLFGNPKEMASDEFVNMLQEALVPTSPRHFAYRMNEPSYCKLLAGSIEKRYGLSGVEPSDVFLTTGNFAGLSLALQVVVEPGDKVVFMEPGWFAYARLIKHARGVPHPVRMTLDDTPDADEADMNSFLEAVGPDTRAVILNTPHNPSGKVYDSEWLGNFSERLKEISLSRGYPVYVIADEAYSDFVYDGKKHETIAKTYPYTIVAYTYNKMTLAPSQRVGYMFLAPSMPGRESLRRPISCLQITLTWCFPNSIMMSSMGRLEAMRDSFKHGKFQKRRDRICKALQEIGYKILVYPRGTFYVLVKTPEDDDIAFCMKLAERDVLVLPGTLFETKGCFRICLTASDKMVENSIARFKECFQSVVKKGEEA